MASMIPQSPGNTARKKLYLLISWYYIHFVWLNFIALLMMVLPIWSKRYYMLLGISVHPGVAVVICLFFGLLSYLTMNDLDGWPPKAIHTGITTSVFYIMLNARIAYVIKVTDMRIIFNEGVASPFIVLAVLHFLGLLLLLPYLIWPAKE